VYHNDQVYAYAGVRTLPRDARSDETASRGPSALAATVRKLLRAARTYAEEGLRGLVLPERLADGRAPLPNELDHSSLVDEGVLGGVGLGVGRRHVGMIGAAVTEHNRNIYTVKIAVYPRTVRDEWFLARDVIYTSRAYATASVSVCLSVCDGSALWSRCMPGRGEGSSRAMLATARPSCSYFNGTGFVNRRSNVARAHIAMRARASLYRHAEQRVSERKSTITQPLPVD